MIKIGGTGKGGKGSKAVFLHQRSTGQIISNTRVGERRQNPDTGKTREQRKGTDRRSIDSPTEVTDGSKTFFRRPAELGKKDFAGSKPAPRDGLLSTDLFRNRRKPNRRQSKRSSSADK